MRNNIKLAVLIIMVILLSSLLVGCMGGGVSQESYDSLKAQLEAQLEASQAQVTELQGEVANLQEENQNMEAQLAAAQGQAGEPESQTAGLDGDELVGETPAETAANIVGYYHETHTYSVTDLFVCGDMAADVWNMLKAQDIPAVIQVGSVDTVVIDIINSNHAWVMAEIAPGEYLALETTGGRVVTEEENALYYRGWSFATPKDYKRHAELVREYNVRVDIINQLQAAAGDVHDQYDEAYDYYQDLVEEYNTKYAGQPVSTESQLHEAKIEAQENMVAEKENRYNQLQGLVADMEGKMNKITAEMNSLATKCGG